jgi:hypothetical protein
VTIITTLEAEAVGFFSNKPDKPAKMRVLKVSLDGKGRAPKKAGKAGQAAPKPMSFTEWVEHYAKMSKGNPV